MNSNQHAHFSQVKSLNRKIFNKENADPNLKKMKDAASRLSDKISESSNKERPELISQLNVIVDKLNIYCSSSK